MEIIIGCEKDSIQPQNAFMFLNYTARLHAFAFYRSLYLVTIIYEI